MSAALGWALQRPITGVAAWLMIVTKRPFDLGDRIIVNNIRGDVVEISLTHIKIKEIGGIVSGEEKSGRTVLVPNSILFEQNIINYTYASNSNILDEISFTITFDSNLERAKEIAIETAENCLSKILGKEEIQPYTLVYFDPNGLKVQLRYFAPANNLQKISSDLTQEVYKKIMCHDDIHLAHPHMQVIMKNNEE
ncbi:MAG: mechanosensitive ion channel family protein [Candidatus Magasanikiibacteriota bacterium]